MEDLYYKDVPSSGIISFGMGFTIQFGDVSSLHFSRSSEKNAKEKNRPICRLWKHV